MAGGAEGESSPHWKAAWRELLREGRLLRVFSLKVTRAEGWAGAWSHQLLFESLLKSIN